MKKERTLFSKSLNMDIISLLGNKFFRISEKSTLSKLVLKFNIFGILNKFIVGIPELVKNVFKKSINVIFSTIKVWMIKDNNNIVIRIIGLKRYSIKVIFSKH